MTRRPSAPRKRAAAWSRAEIALFDKAARIVGDWPREQYLEQIAATPQEKRGDLALHRYRYRLDEFATDVVGPILERTDTLSPPGPIDDAIYLLPLDRPGDPSRIGFRRLVMTGRSIGKTTRQKIRRFHALLYGLTRVSAAIAQTDDDTVGWIDNLRGWVEDPSAELSAIFPFLRETGKTHRITIHTVFGISHLVAKTWGGSLRGFNVRGVRPDAIDLDDIESEENSATEGARNKTQATLQGKVIPLGNLQGGLQVLWSQTPVDPDAVAARAANGHPELLGWDVVSLPVITAWPTSPRWKEARRLYFDVDARPSPVDRHLAALAYYRDHSAEMDEGAEVLDPVRMGPWECHLKLWEVGPTAFAREYEMSTAVAGQVFDPSSWPNHSISIAAGGGMLYTPTLAPISAENREPTDEVASERATPIALRGTPLWAHLDPSDGGDAAALVVAGYIGGRVVELSSTLWEGARLSAVLADLGDILRPFANNGLRALHWEPPSGAASVVEDALRAALIDAGLSLELVPVVSTENKNARIVNTLEPLASGRLISIRHDIDRRCLARGANFQPHRRDNDDDWLDALQRCAEGLLGFRDGETVDVLGALAGAWG